LNSIYVGIDPGSSSGSMCTIVMEEGKPRRVMFFQFAETKSVFDKKAGKKKSKKIAKTNKEFISFVSNTRGFKAYLKARIKVCVERVNSMPSKMKNPQGEVVDVKMGSTSSFKFGGNFHGILMCLDCFGLEYELCTPSKWQRDMLMTKDTKEMNKTDHKNKRRIMIQELYPEVKLTNDKVDSLILAEYARRKI
jgi:hypothetical protein